MKIPKLKIHKGDPPAGFAMVGFYVKRKDADKWYENAIIAGIKYPIILTHKQTAIGKRYILWWKKTKNEKMQGKGW